MCGDVAGWRVAGASKDADRPEVVQTDGLLWASLQFEETAQKLPEVIMLDEVHERSMYIDHCIAKMAQIFEAGGSDCKPKFILASATIDKLVQEPFRGLRGVQITESTVRVPSPYGVEVKDRSNESAIDVVAELFKQKRYDQQILCFLPSTKDVKDSQKIFEEQTGVKASMLHAQQSFKAQNDAIANGSVFFSTNIAETSLTFPGLAFVVDSGMENQPHYDQETKLATLKTVSVSKATAMQRRGRVGRTQNGEYHKLYGPQDITRDHRPPQIELLSMTDMTFKLLLEGGMLSLDSVQEFLMKLVREPPILFVKQRENRAFVCASNTCLQYIPEPTNRYCRSES
jgi:HrpA-like RNA helicase